MIMSLQEQKRMWEIDAKAQLGDKISDEDREFFNANYDKMVEQTYSSWMHWKYHSGTV